MLHGRTKNRLSKRSAVRQFFVLALGVFVCYLVYGWLMEYMSREWKKSGVALGWFLTLVQFVTYTLLAFGQRMVLAATNKNHANFKQMLDGVLKRSLPLLVFCQISFWSVATIALSNASLLYLSYPVQVVFKSCKLIPVMLMGYFILRKSYTINQYFSAILFCSGLCIFILANKAVSPSANTPFGFCLISGALVADAFIGNLMEGSFKEAPKLAASETLLWVKGIGSLYLFVGLLATSRLQEGVAYTLDNPASLAPMIAFSVSGWAGENFVMLLVKRFGTVVTVTTTSVRKAVTIALSFVIYPKPFSWGYLVGFGLIFVGIFQGLRSKHSQKKQNIAAQV